MKKIKQQNMVIIKVVATEFITTRERAKRVIQSAKS